MIMRFPKTTALVDAVFLLTCFGAACSPAAPAALSLERKPLTALPIVKRIKVPAGPAWLEIGFRLGMALENQQQDRISDRPDHR